MVALDFYASDVSAPYLRARGTGQFILGAALLSGGVGLAVLLAHGGGERGLKTSAEYVSRFSSLPFLACMLAKPLARLFPSHATEVLARAYGKLVAAFLTVTVASLAFTILSSYAGGTGMDATTAAFCFYAGFVGVVMALGAAPNAVRPLGGTAPQTLEWIATSCFWLTFVLDDLRHIYGPHRPDDYYGLSLLLLVGAILLRFADDLKQRIYRLA